MFPNAIYLGSILNGFSIKGEAGYWIPTINVVGDFKNAEAY